MIGWNSRRYVQTLHERLSAELPGLRVDGLRPERHPDALRGAAVAEVELERFETSSAGMLGALEGELYASLVVIRKADREDVEIELLDLVFEVATVLQDLRSQDAIGPAQVLSIEPEPLEEPLQMRCVAWRIRYSQQLRIERLRPVERTPYDTLYASREPKVGAQNRDDYERLVP